MGMEEGIGVEEEDVFAGGGTQSLVVGGAVEEVGGVGDEVAGSW